MSIQKTLLFTLCLFFLATGFAHAQLVTVKDSYGIPVSRFLEVDPGVLDNDTLDGQNAGENGVTATLHTDVTKGTLSCQGVGPSLICADGSFEYTPGPGFDGFDSFQYQAVSISETSLPTTVNISACSGGPTVYICWHEASYLATLSEQGHNNTFVESFEGVAWDVARSPSTAPSILSKGITWTTNHPTTNGITTGSGPARTGAWGVYDPKHGSGTGSTFECAGNNPPAYCFTHDGFSGSMPDPDVIYGVGGYISSDFGANVDIILDGIPHNLGSAPGTGHHFMGVIDTAGFNAFEYRELEGTIEQLLLIFGDDFTIATSATTSINTVPVLAAIGDQATDENIQLSIPLSASDSDDGDTVSFSMSGGPTGAELYDNGDGTADFFWRPDYSQAGSYTVTFTVTDNGIPAESDSETITITVNDVNRPPVLSAIGDRSVDENTELSFLLTASDPDGNSLSFVKSGGPTAATLIDHGDGTATFSWTPNIGQAGDHQVTFTVTDDGVPVASDLETITITVVDPFVDITPPQVQITSPANGATLNGTPVTVSGTASDETALAGVTVNGVAATLGSGTFSASVPLVAGANTLTAVATDSSGNTASVQIQVTYTPPDVTPPLVQITSPANGAVLTSASVTVSGTASDETALTSVTVNGVTATLGSGTFSADVPLVAGANTLTAVATDSSGNTASVQIQVTYTPPDVTPPLVQITSPANGAVLTSASVTVSGTASDETALAGVTVNGVTATLGSGTFSASVPLVAGTNTLTAIATDSSGNSASVQIQVTFVVNAVPVADAGFDQTALINDTVTLDGSGSSDADGDAINYSWSLTTPVGSTAVLSDPTAVNPSFMIDIPGNYVAQLIVNDGSVDSAADTVTISTVNSAPVADAGTDQTALVTDTVTLDGSGSIDVDGDALTFSWSLTTPSGSAATLSNPSVVKPSFMIDLPGTYTAQLIVNDTTVNSAPDMVIVSTTNSAPVADAGADQSALVGNTVTLDGSGSTDADGDALSYSWSLTVPAGSAASLSDTTVVNPVFNIDVPGTYIAQLIVNDTAVNSAPDTVNVSTTNSAPVADAGTDQALLVNEIVMLDGSGSSDADGDALTFSWALTAVPAGSAAVLSDTAAVSPNFDADLAGTYVVQLIVNDGSVDSAVDTVSITVSIGLPGSLQFGRERYKVNEDVGSATITVTRVGGSAGAVSVDYSTGDDTARAGSDYTAVSGTLNFAAGVTSQTFTIKILQDSQTEKNEELNISLSNPGGGAGLGLPATATVIITDDTKTDDGSTGGSSSGSIDVITLMLLFSFYLRNFRKNIYS